VQKLISDLLILPECVRKGDFVLNLSKGVTEPEKTLDPYVVTLQHVGQATTLVLSSSFRSGCDRS
jgi:hypothetical protein